MRGFLETASYLLRRTYMCTYGGMVKESDCNSEGADSIPDQCELFAFIIFT